MLQNASQDFMNSWYYFSPYLIFHSHTFLSYFYFFSFPIFIKNMLLIQAPDENIPTDTLLVSLHAASFSNWARYIYATECASFGMGQMWSKGYKKFGFFFFGQVKGRGHVKVPKDQLDISSSLENEPPSLTSFIMPSLLPKD